MQLAIVVPDAIARGDEGDVQDQGLAEGVFRTSSAVRFWSPSVTQVVARVEAAAAACPWFSCTSHTVAERRGIGCWRGTRKYVLLVMDSLGWSGR